jgi:hypothetical protein
MISTEQVAERFPSYNGMSLVDFCDVALPIYRVTASVLVHEAKKLSTIEEFALRSIVLGFSRVEEIQGILGLSDKVVKGALTSLIRSELIAESASGQLILTPHGSDESTAYSRSRPFEQQVTFDYDGITRKVILGHNSELLAPREVNAQGLVEIRPIPARRPTEEEIDLNDVSSHLGQFTRIGDSNLNLLRVRRITRGTRLFYNAVMLIYKDNSSATYEAAFSVDGNISEAHGIAFLRSKGIEKLGILQSIENALDKEEIQNEYPNFAIAKVERKAKAREVRRPRPERASSLESLKKQIADKSGVADPSDPVIEEAELAFRPLPVHEHADQLRKALIDSEDRLLIISPWITSAIVNYDFLKTLETRLREGVDVYIGYGIGQVPNKDEMPVQKLQALADKYKNMTFKFLGDTHAKILIKDNDWYIITSFNWLSFRGDPNRTFREEWGTLVSDSHMVETFFKKIRQRFCS